MSFLPPKTVLKFPISEYMPKPGMYLSPPIRHKTKARQTATEKCEKNKTQQFNEETIAKRPQHYVEQERERTLVFTRLSRKHESWSKPRDPTTHLWEYTLISIKKNITQLVYLTVYQLVYQLVYLTAHNAVNQYFISHVPS